MSVRDIDRHLADLYGARIGSDTVSNRSGVDADAAGSAGRRLAGAGRPGARRLGAERCLESPPAASRDQAPGPAVSSGSGPANASPSALPATAPPADRPPRHSGASPRSRQESCVLSSMFLSGPWPAGAFSRPHAPNRGRSGCSAGALTPRDYSAAGAATFRRPFGRISTTGVWSVPLGSGARTAQHEQRGKYPINQTYWR
jgi:hypothetical protein